MKETTQKEYTNHTNDLVECDIWTNEDESAEIEQQIVKDAQTGTTSEKG